MMSAAALLKATPQPTDKQIIEHMQGNICRCGTYQRIKAAIKSAAAHSSNSDLSASHSTVNKSGVEIFDASKQGA
jgi:isoquinoline 1-oxidoreductase alpha subunit